MNKLFKQKSLKVCAISIVVSGMALVGYNAYSNATMTPEERLFQQNLEALTSVEDDNLALGTCGSYGWTGDSYMIVCNVSYEKAKENYDWWDTPYKGWCCDSCFSTWYCGK